MLKSDWGTRVTGGKKLRLLLINPFASAEVTRKGNHKIGITWLSEEVVVCAWLDRLETGIERCYEHRLRNYTP